MTLTISSMKKLYEKERDKINEKLKKLEHQKLFKNELNNRQKQLNLYKKQQNELKHEVDRQQKKIVDLNKLLVKLKEKYDDSEKQQKIAEAQQEMENIDECTLSEKYTTKSLLHMLGNYKSDILKLKMKVERWKEIMKKLNLEEHELDVATKKLDSKLMRLLGELKQSQVQNCLLLLLEISEFKNWQRRLFQPRSRRWAELLWR